MLDPGQDPRRGAAACGDSAVAPDEPRLPAGDRAEIDAVLNRYCTALDRRDLRVLRACFHPDAALRYDDLVDGDPDAFVDALSGPRGVTTLERTLHLLGTRTIDLAGDVAHVEAYCVAEHLGPPDHPWCRGQVTAWCRYVDRFEHRDGAWRIADRHAVVEWSRNRDTGTVRRRPGASIGDVAE